VGPPGSQQQQQQQQQQPHRRTRNTRCGSSCCGTRTARCPQTSGTTTGPSARRACGRPRRPRRSCSSWAGSRTWCWPATPSAPSRRWTRWRCCGRSWAPLTRTSWAASTR
jgi:hypothetical protein